MGYVSKDIAVITEPDRLALSALPNFVTFASKPSVKQYLEITIKINMTQGTNLAATVLNITQPDGAVNSFKGTITPSAVGGSTFYISATKSDTAENLRQALLNNRWIAANFEVSIPFNLVNNAILNGEIISIKSKGAGTDYNITVAAPGNTANVAYLVTPVVPVSVNNDSISGEASTAEIDLDLYVDADLYFGQDDKPISVASLGHYATTLQKTYSGVPLWFELNSIFAQNNKYNTPPLVVGWFDTGTASVFRFVAKVKTYNSFSFYQSNALFVLNGYGEVSDPLDLTEYTFTGAPIKLLTNKPRTSYVKGQREYLNFIFENTNNAIIAGIPFSIAYRVYTTSDVYVATVYGQTVAQSVLKAVNTCVLNIDDVIATYPGAGIVRVALAFGGEIVSNDQEYTIMPECLHKLLQFSFLNRLGGWDTFNFDSTIQDEIKIDVETFNKTITPAYKRGSSIETVQSSSIANTFIVESAPFSDDIALWLKELAASKVVFDNDLNYVIKEEVTLRKTAAAYNMQTATIKYRLSETYTND